MPPIELKPPGFNKAERGLSLFDGGSELDYLRAKENKTEADYVAKYQDGRWFMMGC